jgi:hypothetical protein
VTQRDQITFVYAVFMLIIVMLIALAIIHEVT